jgi:uroporphyrinogen decarboxylase
MTESSAPPAFLAACRRQPGPHTPVWIMRQAGRYLPEYRKLRERYDFLTMTKTPELITEVTLQPIRRFDMDAAILFSDIMTPLEGMGFDLSFDPAPVIGNPIREARDVDRLRDVEPEEAVPFVLEGIRSLRRELPSSAPLIGFAGAPWTLFCYAVQGQGSKSFALARSFLCSRPDAALALLDKLAGAMTSYLAAQAQAGAQALMIFDSWVGMLAPDDYRRFVLPSMSKMVAGLRPLDLPLIYFPNQGAALLEDVATLDADVVGIDWRVPLSAARSILGPDKAVQGNLDPAALFAPPAELTRRIDRVLEQAGAEPGHVFNLGHGIEPTTDPDAVTRLVDHVHRSTARG